QIVVAKRLRRVIRVFTIGENDDDLVIALLAVGSALRERLLARNCPPAPGDTLRYIRSAIRDHGGDGILYRRQARGLHHVGQWRDRIGGATRIGTFAGSRGSGVYLVEIFRHVLLASRIVAVIGLVRPVIASGSAVVSVPLVGLVGREHRHEKA